jgi:hypothetical protein
MRAVIIIRAPETDQILRPSEKKASATTRNLALEVTRTHIGFLAGTAAVALWLAPTTSASVKRPPPKLKLPAERTSPTGNFFTFEAYVAPTSSKPVANFEMKVCTSAHTPSNTAIAPSLFTLSLAQGGTIAESIAVAKSPAIAPKPLKPLQCTEGWLGFSVPKGKTVATLEYDYNGKISWNVG